MMFKILMNIYLGVTNLPGYGPHPGTPWLFIFTGMGAVAGMDHGLRGVLLGASIMFIPIGLIYLFGAYCRGENYTYYHTNKEPDENHDGS